MKAQHRWQAARPPRAALCAPADFTYHRQSRANRDYSSSATTTATESSEVCPTPQLRANLPFALQSFRLVCYGESVWSGTIHLPGRLLGPSVLCLVFSTALQTQITRSLEVRAQSQADPHHDMRRTKSPRATWISRPAPTPGSVGGEFSINDSHRVPR